MYLLIQMTVDPIMPEDHYKIDEKNKEHNFKYLGREFLRFTHNSRDAERIQVYNFNSVLILKIQDSVNKNAYLDKQPLE